MKTVCSWVIFCKTKSPMIVQNLFWSDKAGQRKGRGCQLHERGGGRLFNPRGVNNLNLQNCPPSENFKCAAPVGESDKIGSGQRNKDVNCELVDVAIVIVMILIITPIRFINYHPSCIKTITHVNPAALHWPLVSDPIIYFSSSERISSGTKTQRCERLSALTRLRRRVMSSSSSSSS